MQIESFGASKALSLVALVAVASLLSGAKAADQCVTSRSCLLLRDSHSAFAFCRYVDGFDLLVRRSNDTFPYLTCPPGTYSPSLSPYKLSLYSSLPLSTKPTNTRFCFMLTASDASTLPGGLCPSALAASLYKLQISTREFEIFTMSSARGV